MVGMVCSMIRFDSLNLTIMALSSTPYILIFETVIHPYAGAIFIRMNDQYILRALELKLE